MTLIQQLTIYGPEVARYLAAVAAGAIGLEFVKWLLYRPKTTADIEKTRAEAEKTRTESMETVIENLQAQYQFVINENKENKEKIAQLSQEVAQLRAELETERAARRVLEDELTNTKAKYSDQRQLNELITQDYERRITRKNADLDRWSARYLELYSDYAVIHRYTVGLHEWMQSQSLTLPFPIPDELNRRIPAYEPDRQES